MKMVTNCNFFRAWLYKCALFRYNALVKREKAGLPAEDNGSITMKKRNRLAALVLCAALLAGALSGCGEKQDAAEPFVLRAGVCAALTTLDPAMNTESDAASVFYAMYENLMRMSDDGSGRAVLTNGMAKEYTEETNYDGTVTYRFTLRSSARWSDGQRVTADDFVYAWQRLVDPATGSPNHALLSMVAGYDEVRAGGNLSLLQVEAKNDSTFCVTLSSACAYFLESVCTAAATMPLRRDLGTGGAETADVTNGAYRVESWDEGDTLTLTRNAEYYEAKLVGADTLQFVFADAERAWTLFEAGELDYAANLPESAIRTLSEGEDWTTSDIYATVCVLYNNQTDLFSDVHIRRAFDLAIDRTAVAAAAGAAKRAATGLVPSGISDAEGAETDYRTTGGTLCAVDEEGYAARLEEAGSELTYAGYYSTSMFPPVELLYVENEENAAAAGALQSAWQEALSVNIMLRGVTQEEYDTRMAERSYELALCELSAQYDDAMSFLDRWCSTDGGNLIGYLNETYDVLLGVARASDNLVARVAFLHDAESMLLEDVALSPVYFDGTAHALRDGLRGAYSDGFGASYLTAVREAE